MAAPTKFNPDIHMDWAWSLAIRGATDQDIADAFHVSERTINRWKYETDASGKPITDENGEKVLSEFGKLLACAKEAADAKVEKCLFQRCTGFDHTEEERILEYNPDGSVKPVKVRTVKKRVPPGRHGNHVLAQQQKAEDGRMVAEAGYYAQDGN